MELTEKEIERRKKISIARKKAIEKNRKKGYQNYLRRKRRLKEMELESKKDSEAVFVDSNGVKVKKRKVGRPKRRGPKRKRKYVSKKPKIDGRTCSTYKRTVDYKLIRCQNGRQVEYLGAFIHKEDAYEAFNAIVKKNEEVIFPRKVRNTGKLTRMTDECVLLEKNRGGEKENNFLRNEYGKLVEQKTNSDTWIVYDKAQLLIEETFWVFGRNPIKERVDFKWIYANFVKTDEVMSNTSFLRVIQYKNKIVLKDDDNKYNIVFCKTEGDAIRMYNLIEEFAKGDKLKTVLFLGSYSAISDKRRRLEAELCAFTGFSKEKIQMSVTKNCKR